MLIFQVQTQTRDDNVEKEVQTNEIEFTEKWTQRPIVLIDESDRFSPDYLRVNNQSSINACGYYF